MGLRGPQAARAARAGTTAAVSDARKSWADGRHVYVAQLRAGVLMTGALSRSIDGVASQVEAIESIGWQLDEFAAFEHRNKATIVALFRRPTHSATIADRA